MLPMLPPTPPYFQAPPATDIPHQLYAFVLAEEDAQPKQIADLRPGWKWATLKSIERVTSEGWWQDVQQIEFELEPSEWVSDSLSA